MTIYVCIWIIIMIFEREKKMHFTIDRFQFNILIEFLSDGHKIVPVSIEDFLKAISYDKI